MLYPIGVQTFATIRERNFVYVDKTDLVYELAKQHVCFLSRPRRFGKSLLISTLEAYFSGRKELFQGLKMEVLEKEWVKYPVFHIDFATDEYSDLKTLHAVLNDYLEKWEERYQVHKISDTYGLRFKNILEAAEQRTGKKAVVLIDEYDKPMLDAIGTEQEEINRNLLKGFYGTFKAADAHLRFVLWTGVTKFSQISVFSGFNQPKDISMDPQFDAICGITEAELYDYFAESIEIMAEDYGCDVEEMKQILKNSMTAIISVKKCLIFIIRSA